MSKILQDTLLLSPTFITTCEVTMQNVKCMKSLVEEKQREAFHDSELFDHTCLVLNQLTEKLKKSSHSIKHVLTQLKTLTATISLP